MSHEFDTATDKLFNARLALDKARLNLKNKTCLDNKTSKDEIDVAVHELVNAYMNFNNVRTWITDSVNFFKYLQ